MMQFVSVLSTRLRVLACLCGVLNSIAYGAAVHVGELDRGGGCTHDIECDDGLPCTIDSCDFPSTGPWGAGTCQHATVADGQVGGVGGPECASQFGFLCGGCDDGVFCNGGETCQGGACAAASPPCSGGQVCSESLNLCQPGPCNAQKTCIGGPTPGVACSANNGCGNGGFCRFADCEDGLLCNGEETCVGGVCQAGENPCGFGATCGERQCSVGGTIDVCITDEDCAAGLGLCSLLGPVCKYGRCCTSGTEPACTRRLLKGICSGATPGTNSGSACSGTSDCNSNSCVQVAASCTGTGGRFYPGDAPLPAAGGNTCPILNDIEVRCPKYASGITPHGNVLGYAGAVSNSNVENPLVGTPINKLGDDYTFTNTGVCVGGSRNGLGCADNSGCPNGGVCNPAGPSVMSIYYLRALVGFSSLYTRVIVEFRDTEGRFVAESVSDPYSLAGLERFFLDPPLIVPSEGFVIMRVTTEYSPDDRFFWASTDAVDVGMNDPDVLWVNDGPVANFLATNPGILAFELEGEKVAAPLGACCDSSGANCTDGVLPWVCEGDGNHFQGAGTTCPVPACDTGACCSTSGDCTTGSESDCTTAGGDFQGYGTDCDPDCCPQPLVAYSGADRCEDVTVLALSVPSIVTVTGDNTSASLQPGEPTCQGGTETPPIELGWYEAFSTIECAMIRVDHCCTDPVKRPAYPVLFDECPCSIPIQSNPNPYLFPQADHARGAPYCDDENQWATFGPMPPGTYYIPVQSGVPGSFGPYQMHITAEACPTAACCVADQCTDGVNQLECDALGGMFLAPPQKAPAVNDCSNTPCATGSCCSGPGECFDVHLGQPVDKSDCDAVDGSFTGGVRCQGGTCASTTVESCSLNAHCPGNENCLGNAQQLSAPSPCPLCSIEGSANCQAFDNAFNFTLSDRHLGFDGQLAADDFQPVSGVLDRICVWGFYLDGDPDAMVLDCDPVVTEDHFRVRVFANDPETGRSPGALVGISTATSQKGILPNTVCQARLETEVYGYELVLDDPIIGLTVGEVYWLEVSNDVSDSMETCNWFWNQRAPYPYSYSFNGHEDGYPDTHAAPFDNAFCLNMGFTPIANAALEGACCTCDGNCSIETLFDCDNANGLWDATADTCSGVVCMTGPPTNDNCIDGPPTITAGTYAVNNQCATTDGYGPIGSELPLQIDFDLWYYVVAPSSCDLVVSECQTGIRFDSVFAVHMNCPPGSPANCDKTICPPCPLNAAISAATQAGLWQDESCLGVSVGGAGLWRASEQILRNADPGECFLIRAGSFPGSRGTAILDIDCSDLFCPPKMSPPCEPYFVEFTRFIAIGCGLFHPCVNHVPVEGAIRVRLTSLHHVSPPYTGAPSVPFTSFEGQTRWVGPPSQYIESAATPTPFWSSRLQCTPHYQDWSTIPIVYVTGPEITPSSTFEYELVKPSCQGMEESCTDVSPTFTIRTTRWGDVESPYNPPSTTAQPDVGDIAALVSKFRSAPGAPIKARALLAGVDQFGNVNMAVDFDFTHIAACVDAFRGRPYPYTISACP